MKINFKIQPYQQQKHQKHPDKVISTQLKIQKRPKKFKKGMVGRQNIPIHLKWATMLSTLRTTALEEHSSLSHLVYIE